MRELGMAVNVFNLTTQKAGRYLWIQGRFTLHSRSPASQGYIVLKNYNAIAHETK